MSKCEECGKEVEKIYEYDYEKLCAECVKEAEDNLEGCLFDREFGDS